MNHIPLLLGGAGLILLSGQKSKKASVKIIHEDANALRMAKLEKATATRIARDRLPPFYAQTSDLTIEELNNDLTLRDELKRYQNVNASQDEIDQFLQEYIKKKAEERRKSESYWPQWPEWMGITIVAGTAAIFLGPELMVAYGLVGEVSILDMALAAWQVADLVKYASEGSQTLAASLLSDAWVGHRVKAGASMLKMLYFALVEGAAVHELITDI